jgi:hypothetical protein
MSTDDLLAGLPAEALIRRGLADARAGLASIPACLVQIGRPRLCRAGLLSAAAAPASVEPELQLYHLLSREPGDAYSRYNALLRELASFESALDHRLSLAPAPRLPSCPSASIRG